MTPAQLSTLKAYILAQPDLASEPANGDGDFNIAQKLNLFPAQDVLVWRTEAPVQGVFDAIDFSKYTPTDAADGSGLHQERLLLIQTKQMNLQNMLVGREAVDASRTNVRNGLRDAVIALPSGASGAAVSAGGASGATVMTALTRKATRGEALFIASTPSTGGVQAGVMGFEGAITAGDVNAARGS